VRDTPDVNGAFQPFRSLAHQGRISAVSVLETRGLHALARKKAVDRFTMNAQDAPDAHGVEPTVVNQPSNRFGVDAQLVGDLAHADEAVGLLLRR
jgi:hypothetical protein